MASLLKRTWNSITSRSEYQELRQDEVDSAIEQRAVELWTEAGKPLIGNLDEFKTLARQEFDNRKLYQFKTLDSVYVYRKDAAVNTKEALGFLKDWVTSLIQLETAALGVLGLATGFKDIFSSPVVKQDGSSHPALFEKTFASLERLLIISSASSILLSMGFALALLNSLPAAAQRIPVSDAAKRSDIYSISNETNERTSDEGQANPQLLLPRRRAVFFGRHAAYFGTVLPDHRRLIAREGEGCSYPLCSLNNPSFSCAVRSE